MMQLEKSLCSDNDTETNCLCPQKFHHPLQKIMVRPLSAVSYYRASENGHCHSPDGVRTTITMHCEFKIFKMAAKVEKFRMLYALFFNRYRCFL